MSRILLINPGWGALFSGRVRRYNRRFTPLSLLNCAALLRQAGHQVELCDQRADPRALDTLKHDYDRCFVTLSPLDRWQCPNTDLAQVDRILGGFPRDRLILMGAQPTLRPQLLLERTGAAGTILGEPEASVVDLADGRRCGEVPGTARLDSDTLLTAPKPTPVDLASLPVPAWDLIDFQRYRYAVLGARMGLLELTRGCPWRCRFCLLKMYGPKYRRKSPEQLVQEVREGWARGMRCAYFQDLEFTLDHDLVRGLCEALDRSGIPLRWACQTRPDTVDPSLLRRMREAGCELIHFGVESGVQRIVDTTEKRQTLESVREGVEAARQVGMRTLCYFLIGLPGESPQDMEATLEFAMRTQPTYASFQVATPYPSTPFHADGEFDEAFPVVFPGVLDEEALQLRARRMTLRYHLRPRYLRARLMGPGRRAALREAALLARYLNWP